VRPAVIVAGAASAAGVAVTYLPLAVATQTAWVALLLQPASSTAGRWFPGRLDDRRGQTRLLVVAGGGGVRRSPPTSWTNYASW